MREFDEEERKIYESLAKAMQDKNNEEIEKSLGRKVREELQAKISNNSDITKNAA